MNEELINILEKVRVLYLRYGIKSITMDDVARELGISKKTLYHYVADKTELVQKVVDLEVNRREYEFEKMCSDGKNAIEELIEVHRFLFNKLKEHNPATEYDLRKYYPDIYKKYNDHTNCKMYEKVLANLQKGLAEGLYRSNLNAEIIARLTVMRAEISGVIDYDNRGILTSPEFFTEAIIYHIRGIANDEGIKVLEKNIEKLNRLENF